MFLGDVYHIYVRCIWGSFFKKIHPIVVEYRKKSPILWKSSLEGAVTRNVVSACQYVNVILSVILRIQIIFLAKHWLQSVELGVSGIHSSRRRITRSSMKRIMLNLSQIHYSRFHQLEDTSPLALARWNRDVISWSESNLNIAMRKMIGLAISPSIPGTRTTHVIIACRLAGTLVFLDHWG